MVGIYYSKKFICRLWHFNLHFLYLFCAISSNLSFLLARNFDFVALNFITGALIGLVRQLPML